MSKSDESVKVVVRVRPISSDEQRNGNAIAVEAFPDSGMITIRNPQAGENEQPRSFTFDAVFGPNVEQKYIYNVCASSVVDSVLNGYNGTIFAYGQTGSGKTHTMEGRPDPTNLKGIIPNSFQHIFEHISSTSDKQYLVRASYLEIYKEEIRDLLSNDPKNSLDLRENVETGVYVKDLTSFVVKNVSEMDHVMQAGKKNRSVGATLMNATSSRSHSIFTIVIECAETTAKGTKIRVGKLNLVDLAGSERQKKTGASGDRLDEATKINLSLSALGNVIKNLVDGKSTYIPYRDSKLTRLLQNSLGGNAKTVMCANCGPADYNYDETLSTLRYANQAKNIKNKPKINEDPKDAMLREYQDEITRLKEQLEATKKGFIIDENGNEVKVHNARQEIVEKIVEREKIVEVKVDMTKEQMAELQKKAEQEKQTLMKQAQDDMKQLIDQQSRTLQERQELQRLLEREATDKKTMEEQKEKLMNKLRSMEEKLIQGGEVISKMTQQESQLRRAQQEVLERQQEQLRLARELAEKEEANIIMEEHFNSLQDEVEAKTKKLKKLLGKYQAAVQEAKDLQDEFQAERSDLLESIRQLSQAVKLKDLIIANFIPEEYAQSIEKRAVWNAEEDKWTIPKLEVTGNNLPSKIPLRPVSHPKLRRPETEYTRNKRQMDSNPRYRNENILSMELDVPERTTQEFEGPGMISRVENILRMDLNDDDGDWIEYGDIGNVNSIVDPYLQYPGSEGGEEGKPPTRKTINGSASASASNSTGEKRSKEKASKKTTSGSSSNNNTTKLSNTGNFSINSDFSDNGFTTTSNNSPQAPSPYEFLDTRSSGSPDELSPARPRTSRRTKRNANLDKEDISNERISSNAMYDGFNSSRGFLSRK